MAEVADAGEFEVTYTADIIDRAAESFVRRYLFARYGRRLALACIINAVGLSLAFWLGGNEPVVLSLLAAIVVLGPLWLFVFYWAYPQRFARRLKERLLPTAHFTISSQCVRVRTSAGSASVPWSRVQAVLEFPAYVIVVFAPLVFSVLPSAGLPPEALEVLRTKGLARVA